MTKSFDKLQTPIKNHIIWLIFPSQFPSLDCLGKADLEPPLLFVSAAGTSPVKGIFFT